MEATPLGKKAPPAAAEGALPPAAQQAVERPSPEPDDAAAGVRTSGGGGEDDDEQVERFYALLENIRAMRGMLGATAAGRKRAREAEPPWRPAFRMEDFELDEVQSDAPCCDAKRESSRGAGRPPAAAGRETTDDDEGGEGEEVVEVKCPRRPQHKARRRAGVLAVDRLGSR